MPKPTVRVKVSGEFACFSRPEMKVERVSYEVITPSAARGILDAIMWKPEMRWHIWQIEVLKPIRFQALKRNEIQSKIAVKGKDGVKAWMNDPAKYQPQSAGAGSKDGTPRNTLALRDVSYIIEAEPIIFDYSGDNTQTKYVEMFQRRVKKGQCHVVPCLGCREFAAHFEPAADDDQPIADSRDLGLMLYDIVFDPSGESNKPVFFHARLDEGVVNTRAEEVLVNEEQRKEVLSCSYRR